MLDMNAYLLHISIKYSLSTLSFCVASGSLKGLPGCMKYPSVSGGFVKGSYADSGNLETCLFNAGAHRLQMIKEPKIITQAFHRITMTKRTYTFATMQTAIAKNKIIDVFMLNNVIELFRIVWN